MTTDWSFPTSRIRVRSRRRPPSRARPECPALPEQRAAILVDHHDAILPADEDAMIGRIGDDVVPTAVATEQELMGHGIR
jgi:hypothetical protein